MCECITCVCVCVCVCVFEACVAIGKRSQSKDCENDERSIENQNWKKDFSESCSDGSRSTGVRLFIIASAHVQIAAAMPYGRCRSANDGNAKCEINRVADVLTHPHRYAHPDAVCARRAFAESENRGKNHIRKRCVYANNAEPKTTYKWKWSFVKWIYLLLINEWWMKSAPNEPRCRSKQNAIIN